MRRWWVSWCEYAEDYRPLRAPPNERVLGWWCSGSGIDSFHRPFSTLLALVVAVDEDEARAAIEADWPGVELWRFVQRRKHDWMPTDRFPLSDWMMARIDRASDDL